MLSWFTGLRELLTNFRGVFDTFQQIMLEDQLANHFKLAKTNNHLRRVHVFFFPKKQKNSKEKYICFGFF